MDYNGFFRDRLHELREEGNYRILPNWNAGPENFPRAKRYREDGEAEVTVWCSNDYLGMGQNPAVIEAMNEALESCGAGAGGTRNISGTNHYHVVLERELADLHAKDAALLFTSGYVSNWAALSTLASRIPGCVVFSDEGNHASMIEGIRHSRAEKRIWKHNDPSDLERQLSEYPKETPKLVAFESVYSMDGDIAPIAAICDVADGVRRHDLSRRGARGRPVRPARRRHCRTRGIDGPARGHRGHAGQGVRRVGGYITGTKELVRLRSAAWPRASSSRPPCPRPWRRARSRVSAS